MNIKEMPGIAHNINGLQQKQPEAIISEQQTQKTDFFATEAFEATPTTSDRGPTGTKVDFSAGVKAGSTIANSPAMLIRAFNTDASTLPPYMQDTPEEQRVTAERMSNEMDHLLEQGKLLAVTSRASLNQIRNIQE